MHASAVGSPETGAPPPRSGAPSAALPSSTISTYCLRRAPCIRSGLATTHHVPGYETGSMSYRAGCGCTPPNGTVGTPRAPAPPVPGVVGTSGGIAGVGEGCGGEGGGVNGTTGGPTCTAPLEASVPAA